MPEYHGKLQAFIDTAAEFIEPAAAPAAAPPAADLSLADILFGNHAAAVRARSLSV